VLHPLTARSNLFNGFHFRHFLLQGVLNSVLKRHRRARAAGTGPLQPDLDHTITLDINKLNIAAVGDVVIAERLDRTRTSTGDVDLPCVGVFEMVDGKISIWRDYFDMATFTSAMQG